MFHSLVTIDPFSVSTHQDNSSEKAGHPEEFENAGVILGAGMT